MIERSQVALRRARLSRRTCSLLLLFLLFTLHGLVALLAGKHAHPVRLDVLACLADLVHLLRELGILALQDGCDFFAFSGLLAEQLVLLFSLRKVSRSVLIVVLHLLVGVFSREDFRVILLHVHAKVLITLQPILAHAILLGVVLLPQRGDRIIDSLKLFFESFHLVLVLLLKLLLLREAGLFGLRNFGVAFLSLVTDFILELLLPLHICFHVLLALTTLAFVVAVRVVG